jgi:hypothetical protein
VGVVPGGAGLLTGWLGLARVGGAALAARRWGSLRAIGGWGVPAALALMVAAAGLTWQPLKDHGWTMYWVQTWGMVAVAAVSVSLIGLRRRPGRDVLPEAPAASPSARS